MRYCFAIAACVAFFAAAPAFAQPPKTSVKLRSGYFSPGLTLPESKSPIHEINLDVQVDAKGEGKGKLELLLTAANYDEYGDAVTGRETDGVNRNRLTGFIAPIVLECTIEFVKAGFVARVNEAGIKRTIFRVKGPKIESALFVATEGPGLTSGRFLVHGKNDRVEHVIPLFEQKPSKEIERAIPCHPGCFPAGTLVRVPDGATPIQRIRKGDAVTVVDAAGKTSSAKVADVFVTRNRVLEVRTDDGNLVTTETQPVAIEAGGFKPAGELKVGDRVWRWIDGQRRAAKVLGISPADRETEVFNLVLGEPTGFIAGDFLVRSKPPEVAAASSAPAVGPAPMPVPGRR